MEKNKSPEYEHLLIGQALRMTYSQGPPGRGPQRGNSTLLSKNRHMTGGGTTEKGLAGRIFSQMKSKRDGGWEMRVTLRSQPRTLNRDTILVARVERTSSRSREREKRGKKKETG